MTIELERKQITINSKLQDDNTQNIIEGDVIVPDTKPDIVSIIQTDGVVKINSKEVHKDMIVIRGSVDFNILYQSDDPSRAVSNISHNINFDQTIDVQTDESDIKSYVDYKIEHVEAAILNGRKINVKAILDCYAKVTKDFEYSAVSNISGDDFQVVTKNVSVEKDVYVEPMNSFISWEADVPIGKPAIKEILRTDTYLADKNIKVTGGKAVVRGAIELKSLYTPDMDESPVEFVTSEIPFSEVLDIEGLEEDGELDVSIKVDNVTTGLKTDEDGDLRVIDYEFSLKFEPTYAQREAYEVIEDAYSVSSKLELESNSIELSKIIDKVKTQSSVKDVVGISDGEDRFEKIYGVVGKTSISDISKENNKVSVEGVIDTTIMYFTGNEEHPVRSYIHQTPFHNSVEIKGVTSETDIEVTPELSKFTYDLINERELELKNILTLNVKAIENKKYDVISKIDEVPLDESIKTMQPSMIVYYVQHGDSLWNIAKKYYTTISEIEKANDIESPDMLYIGQQLVIPKMS